MKKLVLVIIVLLAVFSFLRVQAEETSEESQPEGRFSLYPSYIQFTGDESSLSIGFGLVEGEGEKSRVWNIMPLRFVLRAGDEEFQLAVNGLSFLTRSGVSYGKKILVREIHSGDLISVGGEVVVEGRVEGSIWVFGADVHLVPDSDVTGDVLALGGNVDAQKGSRIAGNKHSLPKLSIPFLGLLTSPQSAETLLFIMQLFRILLYLLVLFLLVHFGQAGLSSAAAHVIGGWKGNLLYLLLALFVFPILVLLLITSVMGIVIVPIAAVILIVLAYFGLAGVSVRIGQWFIKGEQPSASRLYLAGILGFFLLKLPVLLGHFFSLLTSDAFVVVGRFFKVVGAILVYITVLYGLGTGLSSFRKNRNA